MTAEATGTVDDGWRGVANEEEDADPAGAGLRLQARARRLLGVHQDVYADAVAVNGSSDLLVRRTIDRYGHCVFTPAEIGQQSRISSSGWSSGFKPAP